MLHEVQVILQEMIHHCNKCDGKFINEKLLAAHVQNSHEAKEKFKICVVCSKQITKQNIKAHMMRHSSREKNIPCKLCHVFFTSNKSLGTHIWKEHKDDKEYFSRELRDDDIKFPCKLCDLKFMRGELLFTHIRKHEKCHGGMEKKISCKFCNVLFTTNKTLGVHIWKKHKDDKGNFPCKFCDFKFVTRQLLFTHMKKHGVKGIEISKTWESDKIMSKTYCKWCHLKFKRSSYLNIHIVKCKD